MDADTKRYLVAGLLIVFIFLLFAWQYASDYFSHGTASTLGVLLANTVGIAIATGIYLLADKYFI